MRIVKMICHTAYRRRLYACIPPPIHDIYASTYEIVDDLLDERIIPVVLMLFERM